MQTLFGTEMNALFKSKIEQANFGRFVFQNKSTKKIPTPNNFKKQVVLGFGKSHVCTLDIHTYLCHLKYTLEISDSSFATWVHVN